MTPLETRNLAAELAKSRLLVNERDETIRMLQEELQMTVEFAKNRLIVNARDNTIRMLQLQLKMAHSASDMMSPPLVPVEAALPRSIPPFMKMDEPGNVNAIVKPSHALNATPSARVLPLSPPIVSTMPVDVDVTVNATHAASPCITVCNFQSLHFNWIPLYCHQWNPPCPAIAIDAANRLHYARGSRCVRGSRPDSLGNSI